VRRFRDTRSSRGTPLQLGTEGPDLSGGPEDSGIARAIASGVFIDAPSCISSSSRSSANARFKAVPVSAIAAASAGSDCLSRSRLTLAPYPNIRAASRNRPSRAAATANLSAMEWAALVRARKTARDGSLTLPTCTDDNAWLVRILVSASYSPIARNEVKSAATGEHFESAARCNYR
jgi:hypothetical protein